MASSFAFITFLGYPGVASVGRHGQGAGLWRFADLASILKGDDPVAEENVILGAFHQNYARLFYLFAKPPFMWWTSTPSEMEQTRTVEVSALREIARRRANGTVRDVLFGVASPSQSSGLRAALGFGVDVPYPVDTSLAERDKNKTIPGSVGLFCPPKFSKNIYTQLVAVKLAQQRRGGTLFTNLYDQHPVMDWLGISYNARPWMPADEYYNLLSSMEVNLAASWSESFNYQAVEAALLGTASVGEGTGALRRIAHLLMERDSAESIADCIEAVASDPVPFALRAKVSALQLAEENNAALTSILENLSSA